MNAGQAAQPHPRGPRAGGIAKPAVRDRRRSARHPAGGVRRCRAAPPRSRRVLLSWSGSTDAIQRALAVVEIDERIDRITVADRIMEDGGRIGRQTSTVTRAQPVQNRCEVTDRDTLRQIGDGRRDRPAKARGIQIAVVYSKSEQTQARWMSCSTPCRGSVTQTEPASIGGIPGIGQVVDRQTLLEGLTSSRSG